MDNHKHSFKVSKPLLYRGKTYTTMRCIHCPEYYYVERGWFQSVRTDWWVGNLFLMRWKKA